MKIHSAELKQQLACDDTFLALLAGKFISETDKELLRIRVALEQRDVYLAGRIAHKILGSARIFNLEEMIGLLETIEDRSEQQATVEEITVMTNRLTEQWQELREEFLVLKAGAGH